MGKHSAVETNPFQWGDDDVVSRDKRRTPFGKCMDVADGLDGYVIHAVQCPNAGKAWLSGSDCIQLSRYSGPVQPWERHT